MHVLCPSCATEYEIPDIVRPRKLRCANCATEWRALPPAPEAETSVPPEPLIPSMPEPVVAEPPPEPDGPVRAPVSVQSGGKLAGDKLAGDKPGARALRRDDAILIGLWVASLAVIASALFILWHWRIAIGHHWPPSLRIYRLLPSPPPM
jgi:hypothetical protein